MRSRLILFTFAFYLAFALGCSKQPAADNSSDPNAADQNAPASAEQGGSSARQPRERKEHKAEARRMVVPAGTAVTISLGDAIGSKISQSGQTFAGSVAKDVVVGGQVAIRYARHYARTSPTVERRSSAIDRDCPAA